MSEPFVCPPPDTGVQSVLYRLNSFIGLDATLVGVGVVHLVTVGVLVGCAHADASPSRLRWLRRWALGLAVLAMLPFVGAVAVGARRIFRELVKSGWNEWLEWLPRPFSAYTRDMVCAGIILMLGVAAALAPMLVAALSSCRLSLLAEQRDLEPQRRRRWAAIAAMPVALQLALLTWMVADSYAARYALYNLFIERSHHWLAEGLITLAILVAIPLATLAAIALPLRAASRSRPPAPPPADAFSDPSRFGKHAPSAMA